MYFNPYYSYMPRFSSYRSTYTITINTSTRKLTLFKNGASYKTYLVGVGKPSTPTPKGNFRIINKALNPGGPFGARWMGLSIPGYGIHGTNNPSSIGKRVSNGCIRLYNANVIGLYNLVPIGIPVKII
ncbi:L,D-transpeptidase [Clostridium sp. MB40-C1]|uniref:L,D-transpeptidase n=1 Tax=Clostridium sp. MB40-C1 TaxID=3070996 RepID=UPI0027DF74BD|nr:L,D-transpeptidase [Clostridium sp. MB40-C1]WMJ79261.1 L,D-transpeptidase [Clostridium sp. MB40-C1]